MTGSMKEIYIKEIASRTGAQPWQVENCVQLLEDACTIPFISRYRKERTGGMDDVQVGEVKHLMDVFTEMEKRKETILGTIEEAGALTDELRERIENCLSSTTLEDLYLPWRPKRKTRATIAEEKGLGPLAEQMWLRRTDNPEADAAKYISDTVPTAEDALQGARDILAERFAEQRDIRWALRRDYQAGRLQSKLSRTGKSNPDAQKFRSYFDFSIPVRNAPAHTVLAMLRGEAEGILNISIKGDAPRFWQPLLGRLNARRGRPNGSLADQYRIVMADAYDRLLCPTITGDVVREMKEKADEESIRIFGNNLRQLLLAPPLKDTRVLAIDPGFRTGCKVVCLDEQGNLLHYETIFPHPPLSKKVESIVKIGEMVDKYAIQAVVIGEGTAGRETEEFLKRAGLPPEIRILTVSEDGASVYSASDIGREEFPEYDVTVRGAVSIGRRAQDSLSELVKIDPKSLGVGQYQHDVDQKLLKEKLDQTVESCVSMVGVDVNSASPYLLRYVAGIGPALSQNIVDYRRVNGPFHSREELLKVPRLGAKAFQQCAGFLRVPGAPNPLDNSAVHPESYHIVEKMARDLGVKTQELVGNEELCKGIQADGYVTAEAGLPTIQDILQELAKPGRDPRGEEEEFSFDQGVHDIEDLQEGMELPGIVTNVTAFGAFVDVGVHEKGLIHVSRIPRGTELKIRQKVLVKVVSVDAERGRIGLRFIK